MKKAKRELKFPMTKAEKIIGLVMILVHGVALQYAVPFVCAMIPDFPSSGTDMTLYIYVISFFIILVTMFRFLKRSFSDIFDNFFGFLKATILGYVGYYLMMIAISLVVALVNGNFINPNTEEVMESVSVNQNVMLVVAVFLAPIVEEVIFRGALFGSVRKKSRFLAYFLSALLFSVYHLWQFFVRDGFSWTLVLYLFQYVPPTLALCWAYEESGTIWSPIVIHALINYLSVSVTSKL